MAARLRLAKEERRDERERKEKEWELLRDGGVIPGKEVSGNHGEKSSVERHVGNVDRAGGSGASEASASEAGDLRE